MFKYRSFTNKCDYIKNVLPNAPRTLSCVRHILYCLDTVTDLKRELHR